MPPKVKVTKKEIIQTAFELLRNDGEASVNARNIASKLNCSTQPLFSNFESMEELQRAVFSAAYELYLSFLKKESEREEVPKYKAFGMAYIRFAKEEKELFKLLFMCDREGGDLTPTADFEASVEMIKKNCKITRKKAELMHLEIWAFVHGIATMHATSFLTLEWELISNMLTDIYQGVLARHVSKEKQ